MARPIFKKNNYEPYRTGFKGTLGKIYETPPREDNSTKFTTFDMNSRTLDLMPSFMYILQEKGIETILKRLQLYRYTLK
ncbi:hypothetical protein GCM10008967_09320 [Bacillus carboniphilus]|uniref:Uncharacterized protein n=1 Tax=Bacillus carboniphilus TaxID=86663 RepID=A0ABN0VZ58_9BACI